MGTADSSDSIPHSADGKVSSPPSEVPSLKVREFDERLAVDAQVSLVYARKVALVNAEIERLGWGKFNWWLFAQVAYGWAADNIVLECLTLSLTQVDMEMRPRHVQFASVFFYLGTLIGTAFWGFTSDIIGRRLSWNTTLLISFVFGLGSAGATNFVAYCALLCCTGLGTGGNVIIDGSQFIEANAGKNQWLVTVLALFWTFGQIFAALMGWALIPNFSCAQADGCTRSANMGWRYVWITCSGLSFVFWIIRFFVYPIPESPKFLISQGDDLGALTVLKFIAEENGRTLQLTLADLQAAQHEVEAELSRESDKTTDTDKPATSAALPSPAIEPGQDPSCDPLAQLTGAALRKAAVGTWRDTLALFSPAYLRPAFRRAGDTWSTGKFRALFSSPRMAWNTIDVMLLWLLIASGCSLFNTLISLYIKAVGGETGSYSVSKQYAQLLEIAVAGAPGTVIGGVMAELPYVGRRGAMAFWTMLTGVLLFGFTTARSPSAILGWSAGSSVTQDAMYAVLYVMSYELFPTPLRGTGGGLAMAVQRIGGVLAPLVAAYTDTYKVPVMVSASLFLLASVLMLLLPYETRGRTAL